MPRWNSGREAKQRAEWLKEESDIITRDMVIIGRIASLDWQKWWSDARGAYKAPGVKNGR